MTQPQPSWDTKSDGLTEDEVVETLRELPTIRLLRSLRGFPHIINEIATQKGMSKKNVDDLVWMANRLRLFVLVLEQGWELEMTTNEETKTETENSINP